MMPRGLIFSTPGYKRVIATVLTAAVMVQYFILYYTAPLIGDDAMYASIMGATTDDGGASLHGSITAIGAGLEYDGRLSNTIACLLLLLPRWLSAALLTSTLLFCIIFSLRLLAPGRTSLSTLTWMLFATTFFVGWHDSLFLIDLASNYLIPTALTLLYCYLFLTPRRGRRLSAAALATGLLCGVAQQISFAPLLAASAIMLLANGRSSSRRQWLMTVALLGGVASLWHPHMLTRFGDSHPFTVTTLLRNLVAFALLFVWTGVLLLKTPRQRLSGATVMLLTASFVILAMSFLWGTGARMATGVTIFSAAGIAGAWPLRERAHGTTGTDTGARATGNAVVCLLGIITVAHLAYADVMSLRVEKSFRSIVRQISMPDTRQIFYRDPGVKPALSLGKVADFSEVRLSYIHFWPLYCGLSPEGESPGKVLVPEALRMVNSDELVPVEGNTGICRYRGNLVSAAPLPRGDYRIRFGPFSQMCDINFSPFVTDDGQTWYLADILMPSSLLIFYDIDKITTTLPS